MSEVGAIAPDRRSDRIPGFRMRTDLARQREKLLGHIGVDAFQRHVLGDRRALALALEIGTEAAALQLDAVAELLGSIRTSPLSAGLAELLRIFALGIIGAGDERAELAAAKR